MQNAENALCAQTPATPVWLLEIRVPKGGSLDQSLRGSFQIFHLVALVVAQKYLNLQFFEFIECLRGWHANLLHFYDSPDPGFLMQQNESLLP